MAEVLSRYYDKDVSMHSYDNGIGLKVKKDNWEQLLKLFGRLPDLEPLASRSDVDAIIHCQNGAAVAFLSKLYQCLTKRTIQLPAPTPVSSSTAAATIARAPSAADEIPPYAKPTGSAIIRDKMRDPQIAETQDESQINRRVRDIHSQHEEALQVQRVDAGAERYPALRSASKATVLRGATKPVRNDEASPVLMTQHIVKEVQIKAIGDKGIEKLRATREAKENEALGLTSGIGASFDTRGGGAIGSGGGGAGAAGSSPELMQRRKPMDLLNEAVGSSLASMGAISRLQLRGGKDRFESFLDSAYEGQPFDEHETVQVMGELVDDDGVLAFAFLDFPRELWKYAGLLWPFMAEFDDEHAYFTSTVELLTKLGEQCVARDPTAAALLMTDYLLPKLSTGLRRSATKRAPLLRVVYAFVPDAALAHIQTIKRLREALADDLQLFIHLLSILLCMEHELDDALVDLYHYYCCIGLETTCDKLRAACLSMLTPLMAYDTTFVLDLLPRLTQLSSRHAWWEVKTQLMIVASAFLHLAPSQPADDDAGRDFTDQIELCLTIVEREFHPASSLIVRRVGLANLAKNLGMYQELVPLYVDVLFSLPPPVRHIMLEPSTPTSDERGTPAADDARELPIRGASGARYQLLALPSQWDSVAIAKQVFYERKNDKVADFEALLVLQRCFEQLVVGTVDDSTVRMLFDQMKSYVISGLLDADSCGATSQILRSVLATSAAATMDVLGSDDMLDVLQQLVSRNVEDLRQQTAVRLLQDAYNLGPEQAAAIQQLVRRMRAAGDATLFKVSLFSIALDVGM